MSESNAGTKLDQIDPDTLTQEQAMLLFQDKVREHQHTTGDDLIKSWAHVRTLNPKLHAMMTPHDQARNLAGSEPARTYRDSNGMIPGPVPGSPYTEKRDSPAPSLASKLMPRRALHVPNTVNPDTPKAASRKAFTDSSTAAHQSGHLAAAGSHEAAAEIQDKAGDAEAAQMHRLMARYHTLQAKSK